MTKTVTRKEWIEALKSGEYKQGAGYLRTKDDEFCCLGVLCALAEAEMTLRIDDIDDAEEFYWVKTFDGDGWEYDSRTMPSARFLKSVGKLNPEDSRNQADNLALLNDQGCTFEQIADLLIFDSWARGLE